MLRWTAGLFYWAFVMEVPTIEDFRTLEAKFQETVKAIELLVEALPRRPWTVEDIALTVGLNKRSLYKRQYKHHLPNYGVSDFAEGYTRWKPETVIWWMGIPEQDRINRNI